MGWWDKDPEQLGASLRQEALRLQDFCATHRARFSQAEAWFRTARPSHFTASALVVDFRFRSVLLMRHKKLLKWLQPGGHCDGEQDFVSVAVRELFEETGLELLPLRREAIDFDAHQIPANSKESEHLHLDGRILFAGDSKSPLPKNSESNEVVWVPLDQLASWSQDKSLLRALRIANFLEISGQED